MTTVVCTVKLMPESPETDMDDLAQRATKEVANFAGEQDCKTTIEPVAFGLKALNITFTMNEDQGSTEPLEQTLSGLENVASAEITDVRRAIG